MKKDEVIKRYGESAYEKMLEQRREYNKTHKEEAKEYSEKYREEHREELNAADKKYNEEHREEEKAAATRYREEHPKEVIANNREICGKGGKYYDQTLEYNHTGLRGERNRIRMKHANKYRPFKQIIAPDSQIHHERIKTAEYRGIALVEKGPHQYGIVDVIEILDGTITLLTEDQICNGGF